MRADILRDLYSMVDACKAEEEAKEEFRNLLLRVAEANGVRPLNKPDEREERVAFAHHLLRALREPRATIRDRLMARFQVSRSQAYADICEALEVSSELHSSLDGGGK